MQGSHAVVTSFVQFSQTQLLFTSRIKYVFQNIIDIHVVETELFRELVIITEQLDIMVEQIAIDGNGWGWLGQFSAK